MDKNLVFTIYSADEGYRYEYNKDGHEGVIIAKKSANQIIMLMPQQKMAMKSPAESQMSMDSDPFKEYEHYQKDGTLKKIGKETINGIKCTKSELWSKGGDEYGEVKRKIFTVWISEKYDFPIKIINHLDESCDSAMELKNFEPWTPDIQSFEIPEGYKVLDMGALM